MSKTIKSIKPMYKVLFEIGEFGDSVQISIYSVDIKYITVLSCIPKLVRDTFNNGSIRKVLIKCEIYLNKNEEIKFKNIGILNFI